MVIVLGDSNDGDYMNERSNIIPVDVFDKLFSYLDILLPPANDERYDEDEDLNKRKLVLKMTL